MLNGDKLIQQLLAEIAEKQNIYESKVKLIIIMALWPNHYPSIAYVTIFANEGVTTKTMTHNYEYGLAKLFISKENFKAAKN